MENELDLTLRLGLSSPTVETHLSLSTLAIDQVVFPLILSLSLLLIDEAMNNKKNYTHTILKFLMISSL